MIDKKTESNIKAVKGYLEFWSKFHSIYNSAISKEAISREDEAKFLEAKDLIRSKYDELKNGLDVKYSFHSRMTDPVSDILSLNGISFMSEENLRKIGDDWRDSYIFLNSILERLKSRRKRLEQFNPVGVYIKKMIERKFQGN